MLSFLRFRWASWDIHRNGFKIAAKLKAIRKEPFELKNQVKNMQKAIFPEIQETILSLSSKEISEERKDILSPLIAYLKRKVEMGEELSLNFVGSHNVHRSLIAQVWAQLGSTYFDINIRSFSSGLERKKIEVQALKSLKNQGFKIYKKGEDGKVHFAWYSDEADPVVLYSKKLEDPINPPTNFAAIVTCPLDTQFIPRLQQAEIVISMLSPSENTELKNSKVFDAWSRQIANEVFYVFSELKPA